MKKHITIISILFKITLCFGQNDRVFPNYEWLTKVPKFDYSKGILPPSYALLQSLSNIHKGEESRFFNFLYYNDSVNVSNEVKSKIISLLKNEWTLEELSICWLKYSNIANDLDRSRIQRLAAKKRVTSRNISIDSATKFIYDSLSLPYKLKFQDSINHVKVPLQLFNIAAWANIKEAIPILQQLQSNDLYNDNRFVITLALAKLGDKKALLKLYDSVKSYNINNQYYNPYSKDIFFPLLFLNSQESIHAFIYLIDTTKKSKFLYNDEGYIDVYSSTRTITRLFSILKNEDFHQIFKDFSIDNPYMGGEQKINAIFLMKIKEWLINNKGKYKLNFYSMFSNIINTLER